MPNFEVLQNYPGPTYMYYVDDNVWVGPFAGNPHAFVQRYGCCGKSLKSKHSVSQKRHALDRLLSHLEVEERRLNRFLVSFVRPTEGRIVERPPPSRRQRGREASNRGGQAGGRGRAEEPRAEERDQADNRGRGRGRGRAPRAELRVEERDQAGDDAPQVDAPAVVQQPVEFSDDEIDWNAQREADQADNRATRQQEPVVEHSDNERVIGKQVGSRSHEFTHN